MKTISIILCSLIAVAAAQQLAHHPTEFTQTMASGMRIMDRDMAAAPMNGNVDHDFAAMMIPHHQGAIEMAKAELLYGKDPVMRRLAQEILVDQQSEIDALHLWLKKASTANIDPEK